MARAWILSWPAAETRQLLCLLKRDAHAEMQQHAADAEDLDEAGEATGAGTAGGATAAAGLG